MPPYSSDASTVVDGIMTTPKNSIENFEPEEFPSRIPRKYTQHDIRHMMGLEKLRDIRYDISRYGFHSCHVLGNLESLFVEYTDITSAALDQLRGFYERELQGIDEAYAAQQAEIDASYRCHLSCSYLHTKVQAEENKRNLKHATSDILLRRQGELKEARELMHRQLIMNAFVTSKLSWDATKYMKDGIQQGWFRNTEIIASHLNKHPEDSKDGVYRLRLTWVPAEGATSYPATIQIDRIADEIFSLENIVWRPYPPVYEESSHNPFRLTTMQTETTIRCRLVAHFQCAERVEREIAEAAEEAYKKSLPLWKQITYRPGDYQRMLAERARNERQT
ncbi:hypothetical protein NLG97_g6759 [Lecanicillium saksenae]|uniref:Uncharacterized protein n=1 Tax=Lecanicillium saksenae TaxID=468837 RepID=A0ACC1QSI9_9HYPO|nr:hypothetical protein NLG97_g6759 [Lecanicillium saksenae]